MKNPESVSRREFITTTSAALLAGAANNKATAAESADRRRSYPSCGPCQMDSAAAARKFWYR